MRCDANTLSRVTYVLIFFDRSVPGPSEKGSLAKPRSCHPPIYPVGCPTWRSTGLGSECVPVRYIISCKFDAQDCPLSHAQSFFPESEGPKIRNCTKLVASATSRKEALRSD